MADEIPPTAPAAPAPPASLTPSYGGAAQPAAPSELAPEATPTPESPTSVTPGTPQAPAPAYLTDQTGAAKLHADQHKSNGSDPLTPADIGAATSAQGATADTALQPADILDELTSAATDKALSAAQGQVLKGLIDALTALLTSDDVSLDELQEIVDYIKANRGDIDSLGIAGVAGLQTALDAKTAELEAFADDPEANENFDLATWLAKLSIDNVDNTADADKPVSTAQQAALDGKVDLNGSNLINKKKEIARALKSDYSGVISAPPITGSSLPPLWVAESGTITPIGRQILIQDTPEALARMTLDISDYAHLPKIGIEFVASLPESTTSSQVISLQFYTAAATQGRVQLREADNTLRILSGGVDTTVAPSALSFTSQRIRFLVIIDQVQEKFTCVLAYSDGTRRTYFSEQSLPGGCDFATAGPIDEINIYTAGTAQNDLLIEDLCVFTPGIVALGDSIMAGGSGNYAGADSSNYSPYGDVSYSRVISGITQADPAVVTTSTPHQMLSNEPVFIENVTGMTQINDGRYLINVLTDTTFELVGVDSTGFDAYVSGGTALYFGSIKTSPPWKIFAASGYKNWVPSLAVPGSAATNVGSTFISRVASMGFAGVLGNWGVNDISGLGRTAEQIKTALEDDFIVSVTDEGVIPIRVDIKPVNGWSDAFNDTRDDVNNYFYENASALGMINIEITGMGNLAHDLIPSYNIGDSQHLSESGKLYYSELIYSALTE